MSWLTFHTWATAIYVMPMNPIKLDALSLVEGYMEPFFAQGWSLFAPDPLLSSRFVFVGCIVEDTPGTPQEMPLLNLSALYGRFSGPKEGNGSPYLARALQAPLPILFPKYDELTARLMAATDDANPKVARAAQLAAQSRRRNTELGQALLQRVASAACHEHYGAKAKGARLVLQTVEPPRFSHRHLPLSDGRSTRTDLGTYALSEVALP